MNDTKSAELVPTANTTLLRRPQRGTFDRATVYAIFDEALVCHVAFLRAGNPVVLPTTHARIGDTLYLHGAVSNATLQAAGSGSSICVCATLLDGIVLARTAFHHSMNYRSAVVFGSAREVSDDDEKRQALLAIVEHAARGRSAEVGTPTPQELAATRVVALRIEEASAKVRSGPPLDTADDLELDVWAGVVSLCLVPGECEPAPELSPQKRTSRAARRLAIVQDWSIQSERRGELVLTSDAARIDLEAVHEFLAQKAYWAKGRSFASFERAARRSLCVAVIRPDASDELVAFARVVGDRVTFAHLMDVFVVERYRAQGVGRWMVEFVRDLPELMQVRRFSLGTHDAHGFYEHCGFRPVANPEHWMERVSAYPKE